MNLSKMCRSTRYHKKCDAKKMQRVNGGILHVSLDQALKQFSVLMATSYSSPLSNRGEESQRFSVSHCYDAWIFLYRQAPSCKDVDVRVRLS